MCKSAYRFGIRVFNNNDWCWLEENSSSVPNIGSNILIFESIEEARLYINSNDTLSNKKESLDVFRIPSSFEEEEFLMFLIDFDNDEHF
jgi:hypothetical protein